MHTASVGGSRRSSAVGSVGEKGSDMHEDQPSIVEQRAGRVVVYRREGDSPAVEVTFEADTVWLSQDQLAELFQTTKQNVSLHLRNIFREGELLRETTVKESLTVRREGTRTVRRQLELYNLDAIISVGYRVKSSIATQFRVWATERLREFLLQGYTLNQERLAQLGQVVSILARSADELVAGTANVLASYLPGFTLLRDYDEGVIETIPGATPGWTLTVDEARAVIADVAAQFPSDALFGAERGDALAGVVGTIYQGFGGHDLYSTVEEKAANLLYLVVKDHPLSDGNKRSAAALFVVFLARNGILASAAGASRVSNNALAAITLMVAMSSPQEKALMIALIVKMISDT